MVFWARRFLQVFGGFYSAFLREVPASRVLLPWEVAMVLQDDMGKNDGCWFSQVFLLKTLKKEKSWKIPKKTVLMSEILHSLA